MISYHMTPREAVGRRGAQPKPHNPLSGLPSRTAASPLPRSSPQNYLICWIYWTELFDGKKRNGRFVIVGAVQHIASERQGGLRMQSRLSER